jgi:hypothetical protein
MDFRGPKTMIIDLQITKCWKIQVFLLLFDQFAFLKITEYLVQ